MIETGRINVFILSHEGMVQDYAETRHPSRYIGDPDTVTGVCNACERVLTSMSYVSRMHPLSSCIHVE